MLSLIVALSDNYAIGKDGVMPWHLSDDLKRFAQITSGKTIIMGRKTFKSLPKILPGRKHIVISSSPDFNVESDMVVVRSDIDEVLHEYMVKNTEAFIIGGATIYKYALPYCEKLYLTFVSGNFDADTFFPEFDMTEYKEIESSDVTVDSKSGIRFKYVTLQKI